MRIREERAGDEAAIAALTEAAFRDAPHTDGTEHALPAKLREAGELTVSLIAEAGGQVIGHVAFSPVTISDGSQGWYGLGPVSVIPSHQGQGIGAALIREGLARLRQADAQGCVVLGEPAYYSRFGFACDLQLAFPGPPAEYFQRLIFEGPPPCGIVRYAESFY
jgi:predicted N-acetyltransferase YhbS